MCLYADFIFIDGVCQISHEQAINMEEDNMIMSSVLQLLEGIVDSFLHWNKAMPSADRRDCTRAVGPLLYLGWNSCSGCVILDGLVLLKRNCCYQQQPQVLPNQPGLKS